jgi:hypothetical protein
MLREALLEGGARRMAVLKVYPAHLTLNPKSVILGPKPLTKKP